MMFRQLKVGERLQPFTGTTGQGQAAMLVIAVVDIIDGVCHISCHFFLSVVVRGPIVVFTHLPFTVETVMQQVDGAEVRGLVVADGL